ncbi:ABC transporter substrate-binding protein [Arthrobacter sp. CDRTa11]|uniref:ABC transporter substrate-binding protein n=1 Tax=Arthrobacter sp. CDRTa11 TaxID=2651199 RepID=UPI002265BF04|nr:ABC transporter substrate-binding protein [Arthrobacter sp. CDRTa11]UZX03132.1 ABC transporter substrate-binding protein [Arthrobacter sp. CDRTa11]
MMRTRSRLLSTVVTAVVASLAFTACGGSTPESTTTQQGPETAPLLRIGSLQEPQSYDPAQANEGHQAPIYQAVYDTLIKREPDGSLSPMLATSWEPSDGNTTYTLKLRDDVKFSDGTAFDSAAVKANLEHFTKANGPLAGTARSVQSVETPDATTAVIRLSEPDPGLPYSLANAAGYIASPSAVGTEAIKTKPVGSGPYTLDSANTVSGSKITYVRNADYWGDKLPFDKVEFQVLTDETARLNALKSGQIDAAVLNRAATAVEAEGAGLQHKPNEVNWEGIFFFDRNGTKLPELADVRVREALTLAIDREALLQAVHLGKGTLTSQTFRPGTEGYDEALDGKYTYNPDRARELLKEAGAENLTFTFPISPVFDPSIYDSIIQNWQDVGVTVNRHQWGPGQAIPSMLRAEYPIAYMALSQRDDWRHTIFQLAPSAPWNPFKVEDPELKGFIQKAQSGDEAEQKEAAKSINNFIVDNYWFSPLYRLQSHFYFTGSVDVEPQTEQAVPSIYNYRPTGK